MATGRSQHLVDGLPDLGHARRRRCVARTGNDRPAGVPVRSNRSVVGGTGGSATLGPRYRRVGAGTGQVQKLTPMTPGPPWVPITGPMRPLVDLALVGAVQQVDQLAGVLGIAGHHPQVLDAVVLEDLVPQPRAGPSCVVRGLAASSTSPVLDVEDRLDGQHACPSTAGPRRCGRPS